MAGEPSITVVGYLVADPRFQVLESGVQLASFRVAVTPRSFNRRSESWENGETMFFSCTCWRRMAENVGNSLKKGSRVVVTGKLTVRNYTYNEQQRTDWEIQVEDLGVSLAFDNVEVAPGSGRGTSGGGAGAPNYGEGGGFGGRGGYGQGGFSAGGFGSGGNSGGLQYGSADGAPADDPWSTGGFGDEVKF